MDTDFEAKKSDKQKRRAVLSQKQFAIVGLVLTALMNTCGGFLTLLNKLKASSTILDEWRNNLNKQMQYIPKWIYQACVSMPMLNQTGTMARLRHTKNIMMFVKKSPRTITYNTHMFVRSPDGNSELADSDGLISVLQIGAPTKYTPHHTTDIFTMGQSFQYDQELHPESMYIEYKHWKVNNVSDIINKIKDKRNTKSLLSLTNNISGGVYVIGVDDESCQVKGLRMLSQADQAEFRVRLTSWMRADDAGNLRIWGSEGHVPSEDGDNEWEVTFIPVHNCPGGNIHHLVVIHMHHCPGGMFEGVPECYQVTDAGNITNLPFEQWKQRIISELETVTLQQSLTVSQPTPTVSQQLPAVSQQSPPVSQQSPPASQQSPRVSQQSPPVSQQSPPVSQQSPAVTQQSPPVSQQLPGSSKQYCNASWSRCSDWTQYITIDEHSITDAMLRSSHIKKVQMSSPLKLVPSLYDMRLSYSHSDINAIVNHLNTQYPHDIGVALTFPCWAEMFDHNLNIEPPNGHILDTLILFKDLSLEVWSSYRDNLHNTYYKQRKDYSFELCRGMKKSLLDSLQHNAQHTAIHLSIKPYMFSTSTQTLHSFRKPGNALQEYYECCILHSEGILMDTVHTRLVKWLQVKVAWFRDRLNRQLTYHLTQQQCDAFLRFCMDRILLIEAAPGCGKSVMAAYICQYFGGPDKTGNVLYISPMKGFAAIVKRQGNAKTCVADDEITLQKAIRAIAKSNYKVIVVDDIQAMSCSQPIWDMLLETVHDNKAKLLLLMDSDYQDFHDSGSCEALRTSMDTFCKNKHIPRKSRLTLTTNLRNSKKVFSFLVAHIESHEGASSQGEFTCGHDIEGDDVLIRVIHNPWKDSADNDMIQLVTKLITQQGEYRYELRDIVLLVDDTDAQAATKLRHIFSTHSAISTCQAFDVPHQGLVVDLVDEFIGMEAQVCIVIFPSNHRSHNMKYRIFAASRGIMRTELVFMADISADLVNNMAFSNLAEAEVSTRTPAK